MTAVLAADDTRATGFAGGVLDARTTCGGRVEWIEGRLT
jgi:hypothetical protein